MSLFAMRRTIKRHTIRRSATTWRFVLLGAMLCCATPAAAELLYVDGRDDPIAARNVRKENGKVYFEQQLPTGERVAGELPESQVTDILRVVKADRLESLTPDQPQGYFEYAEELVEKRRDPVAADTAIRLFVIAAYLDPERWGRSALLGMSGLTVRTAEQRKYRAMAFLLSADRRLLVNARVSAAAPPRSPSSTEPPPQAAAVAQCLRTLRQGNRTAAVRMAERAQLEKVWDQIAPLFTFKDFEAASSAVCPDCTRGRVDCPDCKGKGRASSSCRTCRGKTRVPCFACLGEYRNPATSPAVLSKLLRQELLLTPRAGRDNAPDLQQANEKEQASESWAKIIARLETSREAAQPTALPTLDLLTITPYDPRENVFRNGNWVRP